MNQLATVPGVDRLLVQQHNGLDLGRIPAAPPPHENHRGDHSTDRDRSPGQRNMASTERRNEQAYRDE
jgi:hypothetical protein